MAARTETRDDIREKHEKTIADYVGDMVALESHIEEALDRQLSEAKDDPEALAAIQEFHDTVKRHRDTLIALQNETGTTAGSPIKAAGAALIGKAAGVINLLRTEGISKALRDDYAAFNLAAISYSMLHTTAKSLGDERVASLAERNLGDYARCVMRINQLMPEVVIRELQKDDHQVDTSAVEPTRTMVERAWSTR
jgi:ferritin-like metal-binding protein YciE